jgi:hypothetical protein
MVLCFVFCVCVFVQVCSKVGILVFLEFLVLGNNFFLFFLFLFMGH